MDHWLPRTKTAMQYAGNGALWLPGSTTWRHDLPDLQDPARAIAEARRRGGLAGSGIPQRTRKRVSGGRVAVRTVHTRDRANRP